MPLPAMTSYRLSAARSVTAEVLTAPTDPRGGGTLKIIGCDYPAYIGTVMSFGASSPFIKRAGPSLVDQISVGAILRFEIAPSTSGRFYALDLIEVCSTPYSGTSGGSRS